MFCKFSEVDFDGIVRWVELLVINNNFKMIDYYERKNWEGQL